LWFLRLVSAWVFSLFAFGRFSILASERGNSGHPKRNANRDVIQGNTHRRSNADSDGK
jgi:hypothetical protein